MHRVTVVDRLFSAARVVMLVSIASCLIGAAQAGAREWHWGIGTGLTFLNAEGDLGWSTSPRGPILAEIDLDPSDFRDLTRSAIGGGGYVTDGNWMIQFAAGKLELGDDPTGSLATGESYSADVSFDITKANFSVGYPVYRNPEGSVTLRPYVGARYTKHDLGFDLTVAGEPVVARGQDSNWTDLLVGASLGVGLMPKLSWSAGFDAGFGGSNGTYNFTSGLTWQAWRRLSITPSFFYTAIDYENGDLGDSDWYLYDVNEFGASVTFLVNF